MMNSTARKCLWWGVGLIVIGAGLLLFLPDLLGRYYPEVWTDASGMAVYQVVTMVLSILREAAVAVGAALIGAGVVINTLKPGEAQ